MRHMRILVFICFLLSAALLALPASATAANTPHLKLVPASNPNYAYAGRIDFSTPAAPKFYWAGDSATIGFTGRSFDVVLDDPNGGVYFDIIIDGDGKHRHVIHCRKGRHVYAVARHLADTPHTLEVFRRVDPTLPVVMFDGIKIAKPATVFRPNLHHSLNIVYYGDSITSGFGVLAPSGGDQRKLAYMDNYVAYGAIVARALHAGYRSISLSGIGILESWFPLVMPRMYDRLAPKDPTSHWNFSSWTPDIVVVNLLQNDSWLLPRRKHPPSRQQIIDAYAGFIHSLRTHYPHAAIVCMLGNMSITAKGSAWPGYVEAAVEHMRAEGDHDLYMLIVPFKNTPGHPDIAEQRELAQALEARITAIRSSNR
ncbi:MAG: GDSL-type esterase/lipase family protein [Rhodanobacteraceae bacterium]